MQNLCDERPSLQRIICALILGSDHPITPVEIQKILETVEEEDRAAAEIDTSDITDEDLAETQAEADRRKASSAEASGAPVQEPAKPVAEEKLELAKDYQKTLSLAGVKKVIKDIQDDFHRLGLGMELVEVAGGYRFQTAPDCGKWVRKMLNKGKPTRLARPAIETLAIIAYRQPVARSEIESIRGVCAGHVIKALMEMQLVRIIGRSDLPGRPFLFGTTPAFLDHFGLSSLNELEPIKK